MMSIALLVSAVLFPAAPANGGLASSEPETTTEPVESAESVARVYDG